MELMVVVTILSILTLTAGLSVGVGDRGRRSDTDLLTRLDARLRDAALFDRATVGFRIDDDGLQPLSAGPDGWAETGAAITWQGDAEWVDGALTVVAYLPDGRNSPFRVTLRTADVLRDCVSDGWSPVTCDPQ